MNHQQDRSGAAAEDGELVGLRSSSLRAILFELPFGSPPERRQADPCPLSARELEILKRLGQDKGLQADRR